MKDTIQADLKAAMLSGDKQRAEALSLVKAAILNKEVELNVRDTGLSDEQIVEVLRKESKKRVEAAEMYDKAERSEQASKERFEQEVIAKYLPAQMSDEELAGAVDAAIADAGEVSIKDMGRVIGAVKSKVGNNADGGRIASLVKQKLT